MYNIGEGLIGGIIVLCVLSILLFWGGYELVDWLFIDDAIKTTAPIKPEIELIIKNNVVDTLYIYRKP